MSASLVPHESHYVANRARCLARFDKVFRVVARELERAHDPEWVRHLVTDTRRGFEDILPRLPYIGGRRNAFSEVVTVNGYMVPAWKVLRAEGWAVEDFIGLCILVADHFFKAIPTFLRRLTGKLVFFEPLGWRYFRRQAERSQKRQYTHDFIYTAEVIKAGEGKTLSLVFDQCLVMILYEQEGVPELKPYCSFFDVLLAKEMGWGVDASQTIGLGCTQCVLKYNNLGQFTLPLQLRAVYDGLEERLGFRIE